MSNLQPTLSESIPGLIILAIIGISIAVYYGISDSTTEVESLKAQIVAKDKQLAKSRVMFAESLQENLANAPIMAASNKKPEDINVEGLMQASYDKIMVCVGGGSCEGVPEEEYK